MIHSYVLPPIIDQKWVCSKKLTSCYSAYAYGMHLQSHMPHMICVSCLCPCRVKLNGHLWKWADKIKPMIEKPGVILETLNFSGELDSWVHSLGHFLGLFGKLDKRGLNTWFQNEKKRFKFRNSKKVLLETF